MQSSRWCDRYEWIGQPFGRDFSRVFQLDEECKVPTRSRSGDTLFERQQNLDGSRLCALSQDRNGASLTEVVAAIHAIHDDRNIRAHAALVFTLRRRKDGHILFQSEQ